MGGGHGEWGNVRMGECFKEGIGEWGNASRGMFQGGNGGMGE